MADELPPSVTVPSIEVVQPSPTSAVLGFVVGGQVKNFEAGPSFGQLAGTFGASQVGMLDGRTVEGRISAIPEEVDAAGTADTKVGAHNADAAAHPAMSAFITAEADRAEDAADAAQAYAGVVTYTTKALMLADTSQPNPTRGVVTNDATVANNGYYTWNGTSWGYDGLQPANTSDVQSLQSLIKPNGTAPAQATVVTDPDGWQVAAFEGDGSFETNGFRVQVTPGSDGFKVLDVDGWCLYDSADPSGVTATGNWANKRFLLFGDSITETGSPSTGDFGTGVRANWPVYAQTFLQMSDLKNYAVSGASFREYVGQTNWQKISYQISQAISNGETPDVIVLSAGTNDGVAFLGNYATAMGKSTLGSLDMTLTAEAMRWVLWTAETAWPGVPIFYANPLQRADFETSDRQPLLDLVAQMAGRYSCKQIDAHHESGVVKDFEVNGSPGRFLSDGLHPNPAGQLIQARLYSRAIKNAFNF